MSTILEQTIQTIEESKNLVFFGGAGVSTESGIPDFRSVDGVYNQSYRYPPETILSQSFFKKNKEEFYQFYWDKIICTSAKPNITHCKLAELEEVGKLSAIITQNIDGLHQLAGSKKVLELHGSVHRNFCISCGKPYSLEKLLCNKELLNNKEFAIGKELLNSNEYLENKKLSENHIADNEVCVPHCDCGGVIKPDVVLYEEGLDEKVIHQSIQYISEADTLIIGGTSLSVYPAAGFIRYFNGKHLILINKTETSFDKHADLVIHCGLGEVFSRVMVDKLGSI